MCTIVLASGLWPSLPLLVAANRDEMLKRPAEPPSVRALGNLRVLAPRDAQAGGTWLGLSSTGVFVGITNRYDPSATGRTFPGSRGQIVLDALQAGTVEAGAERIATMDPAHQGPFHLVLADREGARVVYSDGTRMHRRDVGVGVTMLTERSFDAAPTRREPWLAETLAGLADRRGAPPSVQECQRWLSHHDDDPLEGTCVHADARGYGTRSTTVVRLAADGSTEFHHADGPPCRTPLVLQPTL